MITGGAVTAIVSDAASALFCWGGSEPEAGLR
jgi:hypothetical protein